MERKGGREKERRRGGEEERREEERRRRGEERGERRGEERRGEERRGEERRGEERRERVESLNRFNATSKLRVLPFSCSISSDLTVGVFNGETLRIVRVTNESKHLEKMMATLGVAFSILLPIPWSQNQTANYALLLSSLPSPFHHPVVLSLVLLLHVPLPSLSLFTLPSPLPSPPPLLPSSPKQLTSQSGRMVATWYVAGSLSTIQFSERDMILDTGSYGNHNNELEMGVVWQFCA